MSSSVLSRATGPGERNSGRFRTIQTIERTPVAGSVDRKARRAAWTIGGDKAPGYKAGLANLTTDQSSMLAHPIARAAASIRRRRRRRHSPALSRCGPPTGVDTDCGLRHRRAEWGRCRATARRESSHEQARFWAPGRPADARRSQFTPDPPRGIAGGLVAEVTGHRPAHRLLRRAGLERWSPQTAAELGVTSRRADARVQRSQARPRRRPQRAPDTSPVLIKGVWRTPPHFPLA